jgi:hypothetical protein
MRWPQFMWVPGYEQPWLVDVLMFVPGVALVIVPAVYCTFVAKTYVPAFDAKTEIRGETP